MENWLISLQRETRNLSGAELQATHVLHRQRTLFFLYAEHLSGGELQTD